jgi:predicted DNA-binding transcriptional regulator AlpA
LLEMNLPPPEVRLNIGQIATLLGVSRYKMDRIIDLNQGPTLFALGKRRYSTPSLVRQWLAERQRAATSQPTAA